MLRAIAWHAWGRGARRTAGDGNLQRNLKGTSYTFTGHYERSTCDSRNRTFSHRNVLACNEIAYTQRETDLYNLAAFVCPLKLPSQLSGVLGTFAKSRIITMHAQWKRITLRKIVYCAWNQFRKYPLLALHLYQYMI